MTPHLFMSRSLTLSDGLAIQREDLAKWRKVLNDKAYTMLAAYADKKNGELPLDEREADGYDVTRGDGLSSFVHNLCLTFPEVPSYPR